MLKSLEIKAEMLELKNKITGMIDGEQDVPQDIQDKLDELLTEYNIAKTAESEAVKINKTIVKGEKKMDKKICNQVIKSLLKGEKVDAELVAQSGIQGIVDTVGTVGNVESVGARGGYLIPEEYLDLDKYGADFVSVPARVINVNLPKGHIPMVDLGQAKDGKFLAKHDELDTVGKNNPVFTTLPYDCETYQGIVPVSMDLIEDTSDILPVISECFALTSKAQENTEILKALNGISSVKTSNCGTGKTFADKEAIQAIRKAILGKLSGINRSKAKIVVCDTTFAKLAMIEDAEGHPYLCQDVTNPSVYRLEGHEVIAIDDAFMTASNTLTEVAWVGNFDRVALVQRKGLEIKSDASNMFDKDALAVKGKKRMDCIVLEAGAFVKVATGA